MLISLTVALSLLISDYKLAFCKTEIHKQSRHANPILNVLKDKEINKTLQLINYFKCPRCYPISEISDFFIKDSSLLTKLALPDFEALLLESEVESAKLREWFKAHKPISSKAKAWYYSDLYDKTKNPSHFSKFKKIWISSSFNKELECSYHKLYKGKLSVLEIEKKLERILWNSRNDPTHGFTKCLNKRLYKKQLAKAKAYSNIYKKPKVIAGNLAVYIKKHSLNPGLAEYLVIANLLRKDEDALALKMLKRVSNSKANQTKWWKLKHIAARNSLRDKQYKEAYDLVASHKLGTKARLVDLYEKSFLSGWIALTFLKDTTLAMKHFRVSHSLAKLATSKAKAAYWLGKTRETEKDQQKAKYWYKKAAQYPFNFYGQLSLGKIKQKINVNDYICKGSTASKTQGPEFNEIKKLLVEAIILNEYGYSHIAHKAVGIITRSKLSSSEFHALLSHINKHKAYSLAVRVARSLMNLGHPLMHEAFPKPVKFHHGRHKDSIYLGLIRQESSFDINACSPVGAQGLMQLMPATASQLDNILQLPNKNNIPLSAINLMKGSHYLDSLIKHFDSYILAIASYNAGKRAVERWVKVYGHPNKSDIDRIINWIEMIPYGETRFYVIKVIENASIYELLERSKVDSSKLPLIKFLKNEI